MYLSNTKQLIHIYIPNYTALLHSHPIHLWCHIQLHQSLMYLRVKALQQH